MSLMRPMAIAAFAMITLILLSPSFAWATEISVEYRIDKNGTISKAFVSDEKGIVTVYIVGGQDGKLGASVPGACSIKVQGRVAGSHFKGSLVALEDDHTYFTKAEAAEENYMLEAKFADDKLIVLSSVTFYCGVRTNFAGIYTKIKGQCE